MRDANKIQKLLNLTSSGNDAEALLALRTAQKLLGEGDEAQLGDILARTEVGLRAFVSEELYNELEDLFEIEVSKNDVLRKALTDKDKSIRKYQRDIMNLKRDVDRLEDKLETSKHTIHELTEELMMLKGH